MEHPEAESATSSITLASIDRHSGARSGAWAAASAQAGKCRHAILRSRPGACRICDVYSSIALRRPPDKFPDAANLEHFGLRSRWYHRMRIDRSAIIQIDPRHRRRMVGDRGSAAGDHAGVLRFACTASSSARKSWSGLLRSFLDSKGWSQEWPYVGARNSPWNQRAVSLDFIGSTSATARS
jgi:hypothetical protein